jgi:hypothetical protein
MPFCPQCRFEYQQSVKACPECKVDLVEVLEGVPTTDEDFIEVYSVNSRMEADVIRSLLEEEQVPCLIRDTRVFPVLPDWRAQFIVQVFRGKENQAHKLIEDARTDGAVSDQGKFL